MGRPAKSTTNASVNTEQIAPISENDKEKQELKKQIALLQEQMATLMSAQKITIEEVPKAKKTKNIRIVNLSSGGLNLLGTRNHHIDKQFGYISVTETEARNIVVNMPKTVTSGMIYIPDEEFVKECELDSFSANLLSDKDLKELLANDASYVCEVFANASDEQKTIILSMVSEKKLQKEYVDANILVELGRLSGKDLLGIEPIEEG